MAITYGSWVEGRNESGTFRGRVDLLNAGSVPYVDDGAEVRGSDDMPVARVVVWEQENKEWKPTDIRVARLANELSEIDPLPEDKPDTLALYRPVNDAFWGKTKSAIQRASNDALSLTMGEPSAAQLALINKFKPQGAADYKASEICTIPWLASHSLMQYGGGCWSPEALIEMAFMAPGKPMLLDHKSWDIAASVGFIYECHLVQVDASAIDYEGDSILSQILWASGGQFLANNQDIIRRNGGLQLLVMETAHDVNSPFVDGVRMGRIRSCSTGCYLAEDSYCCPVCTEEKGIYTPMFGETDCPHLPSQWYSRHEVSLNPELQKRIVEYMIKIGVISYEELSAVNSPGLPGAGRL